MSSRDDILQAVRRNQPPTTPLTGLQRFDHPAADLVGRFADAVRAAAGDVVDSCVERLDAVIAQRYPDARTIASPLSAVTAVNVQLDVVDRPHDLALLDLLVCEAEFGVAENGAVWMPASKMGQRAAPFLAQHLLIVLDRRQLVWTMHDAYARVCIDDDGFGLFIAGPSKTADIEQSLVIGAHGPRSLTIVLT